MVKDSYRYYDETIPKGLIIYTLTTILQSMINTKLVSKGFDTAMKTDS